MLKSGGCVYILILLQLINLINARSPVRSFEETDIFFEEEMTMTVDDIKLLDRKNVYRSNSSKNSRSHLIQYNDPSRVIFPEEDYEELQLHPPQDIFESVLKINQISTCTEQDIFCENVDTYPYVHLNDILQKNSLLKEVFKNNHLEEKPSDRVEDTNSYLCPSVVKHIMPKLGKSMMKIWRYVINQDEFVQTIRVEVCKSEGEPCDLISELPNGYKIACRQKYIYTHLLSLGSSGEPIIEIFPLPSACACAYTRNYDFFSRIGARFTPNRRKGGNVLN